MQDAGSDYAAAVVSHRTWVPPRARADFSGYGYTADKTLDDLSSQISQDWEVAHDLDDGYPNTVSFVSGTSVPEFETELTGRAPSRTVVSAASSWSAQVVNGTGTGFADTLVIPPTASGGPRAGEWIVVTVNVRNVLATIDCNDELFEQVMSAADVTVFTTVYVRKVSADLAASGASVVFSFAGTAPTTYTIIAAAVGLRDGKDQQVDMELTTASIVANAGVGPSLSAPAVTVAAAPTRAPTEAALIVSAFARGSAGAANWVPPSGDTEIRDAVGGNGALNVNAELNYDPTVRAAGSYTKTATTGAGAVTDATMAALVFTAITWNQLRGVEFWSPLRADSPLYGVERDLAGFTLDTGLVTDAGIKYVRIFTGQTVNIPVKGGKAQLKTVSATRMKLMRQVRPFAFPARYAGGLRACWPVSWAVAQAGIYAGPKPRDGYTTLYYPNHGSLWRFHDAGYPDGNRLATSGIERWNVVEIASGGTFASGTSLEDADWIEGPYVAAPDLQLRAARSRRAYTQNPPFDQSDGQPAALTVGGHKGRLEAWVKGDTTDWSQAPGGSSNVTALLKLQMINVTNSASAQMGLDVQRRVYITVNDAVTGAKTLTGPQLPLDGEWHFIGAAYDFDSDKLWTCMDNTVGSASASLATTNLPNNNVNNFDITNSFILSYLPFSDFTFSTGAQANPDDFPRWRNHADFAPTAQVGLSRNKLVALCETKPREIWEFAASYAQSELAAMRCDELDQFQYLPLSWWVKPEQQQVSALAVSSALNSGSFDVDNDPARIRNAVSVSYSEASVPGFTAEAGLYRRAYELPTNQEIAIPPGMTTLRVTFSAPIVGLNQIITAVDSTTIPASATADPSTSYASYNLASDGSGGYTTASISATVVGWNAGEALIQFSNSSLFTYYLANGVNLPALALAGLPVSTVQTYATDTDLSAVSVRRGERSLSVSAGGVQTSESARRLARNLKTNLRLPMTTVGDDSSGVTVVADARRQPGDLSQFVDTESGTDGSLWRLQSVRHAGSGAAYTQQVVARKTYPICIVGESLVGRSIVGPSS